LLASGRGVVDLSHFDVVTVSGPDRLTWLHALTTQHLEGLTVGSSALSLILSPHGHVEFELHLVDDGSTTWIITQPGTALALVDYLTSMKFMTRVEIADRSADYAVVWEPVMDRDSEYPTWIEPADFAGTGRVDAGSDRGGSADKYVPSRPHGLPGREVILPRAELGGRLTSESAGTWAWNALRVAAAVPRIGFETDHRTLPHEVGWIGPAVHLAKGCYRGQEAVARVHNLGRPPRRLALAHLDGSDEALPAHGDPVFFEGAEVGWVGTAARHYELGPIATVIVKRSVPEKATITVHHGDARIAGALEQVVV
jgi:folate-binding protein YgfZ